MTQSNTKRPRGPRKPIITPATIQRANELIIEHRAAIADLAHLMASTAGRSRVQVDVRGTDGIASTYAVLRDGLVQLLSKDIAALEGEAKRLGVQLVEDAPPPLLSLAAPQPPLAAPDGPLLGQAHTAEAA